MGKKVQCTFITPVLKKCNVGANKLEDRINVLPDEILITILSHLTIEEAARTSVLSHRWENLWKFSTGSLDFDSSKMELEIFNYPKLFKDKRSDFVSWVNQVCNSHKGPTIEMFRVRFELDKRSRCHIDKWIKFAIAKKTQILELNFTQFFGRYMPSKRYTLPHKYYVHMQSPLGLSRIKYLKSLCFRFVNVTGEHLEFFLSNCPVLEELCVQASEHLVDLKVIGSSLRLKYLEIANCWNVNLVQISASNLASLISSSMQMRLHIMYAPRLVNVSICAGFPEPISATFHSVSSYLLQLETLTLELFYKGNFELPQLPVLLNLRNLRWIVHPYGEISLLGLTSLIEASPFLQKFTIEFWDDGCGRQREVERATGCPHQCLKVVELTGFVGHAVDVEIAIYLLEHAVNLEKIIIDPVEPCMVGSQVVFEEKEKKKEAIRERALLLKTVLPPGAELVVL